MDDLDIFEITGTLSKSPTHCADHLINPLFRSSGRFPDHLDTFQIIRTLFRSSGHFSDHLVTFQIIWTLFRSSGTFGSSEHFPDHPKVFRSCGIAAQSCCCNFIPVPQNNNITNNVYTNNCIYVFESHQKYRLTCEKN